MATATAAAPAARAASGLYGRRKARDRLMMALSVAAAALGLFVLGAILWTLFSNGTEAVLFNGREGLNASIFTEATPAPGSAGGLANAIYGSFVMTVVAALIAAPVGILAATFLAEYARGTAVGETIKFLNDILLSAPSIVIGVFVWTLVVRPFGYSGLAGAVALGIIAVPVIVRTTDDMLSLVPVGLREAAASLGAPRWKVITLIAYRAARNGIITGVLLAIARISGETAPLLFTALNNQFWNTSLVDSPMANLPVTIYVFAGSPFAEWQQLAWGGALIITVTVLLLNILARTVAALTTKG